MIPSRDPPRETPFSRPKSRKQISLVLADPFDLLPPFTALHQFRSHWFSVPSVQIETEVGMNYKDIFWMACDSTEQLRAEYGPFHSREEAELEARKLGFGYLLRYEHILGPNEEIEEVRCVFLELQNVPTAPKDRKSV